MKSRLFTENGQALILIAISAIALFALVGLAVDGSMQFSDRRHAQNAADTAALAGALAMVKSDPDWVLAAKDRAANNGYTGDLVRSIVEVHNPPISGIYSNCSDVHFTCTDYVQVIITSYVNTTFARVIGVDQLENRVQAVAGTIAQNNNYNFGGSAIVALNRQGCDTLVVNGGSNVIVTGGGLFSNSDSSTCAFFRQSCPSGVITVWTDSSQTSNGNITMVGNTNSPCDYATHANLTSGSKQIPFPPPYQEIAEPAECLETVNTNYTVTGTGSNKIATLSPGHYSTIPLNGQWKDVIFNPGVYCIDSSLSSPNSLTVSGSTSGVFLYIRAGGSFTFNGGSTINLWGINDSNVVDDPSLAQYKGHLIYVAPDYSLGTPPNCKINGSSDYALKGTIYAPYCAVTINGTSNTGNFQSQVIGYTVSMLGTADVNLIYNAGDNATFVIPLQVGLSR